MECQHKKQFDYIWPDELPRGVLGRFDPIPLPSGDISRHCVSCGKELSRRRVYVTGDGENVDVKGIILTLEAAKTSEVNC